MAAHYIIRVFVSERGRLLPVDALEHICPEDWPGILQGFQKGLKTDGWLYLTVEVPDPEEVKASYERSRSMGLPVLYGEIADNVEESYKQVKTLHSSEVKPDIADVALYHYHPSHDQVRTWLEEAGLSLDGRVRGYEYARDFGGVCYVFLRGVNCSHGPDYGLFCDRPEPRLVHALGEALIPDYA